MCVTKVVRIVYVIAQKLMKKIWVYILVARSRFILFAPWIRQRPDVNIFSLSCIVCESFENFVYFDISASFEFVIPLCKVSLKVVKSIRFQFDLLLINFIIKTGLTRTHQYEVRFVCCFNYCVVGLCSLQ